jgi:hypothetical protein
MLRNVSGVAQEYCTSIKKYKIIINPAKAEDISGFPLPSKSTR